MTGAHPLLDVRHLKKHFRVSGGFLRKPGTVRAVDDVSFRLAAGKTLGLVGESGSGKTTVARLVLRLLACTSGEILLDGENLATAPPGEMKRLRRKMSVVFQDPNASLNPRMTIRRSLERPLQVNQEGTANPEERILEAIARVHLREEVLHRYPHQLSGGQQQRVCVARAMLLRPRLLVLDEPTSALDISVQAQVLNVLTDLQRTLGLAYLFISHDLNVVRYVSDHTAVMYLGRIVETGPSEMVFENALHPYTQGLFFASPPTSPRERGRRRPLLSSDPPSLLDLPPGCRLAPRCPYRTDLCDTEEPAMREAAPGHFVACHRLAE